MENQIACPKCGARMETTGRSEFPVCTACEGVWLRGSQVLERDLYRGHELPSLAKHGRETRYFCPECANVRLQAIFHDEVELDWCADCHGLYLDAGEIDKVKRSSSAGEFSASGFAAGELLWEFAGKAIRAVFDGLSSA